MEPQAFDKESGGAVVSDSLRSENQDTYSNHHPQSHLVFANQFLHTNQLDSSQHQYQPFFGLNRVIAPYPPTSEQLYSNGCPFPSIPNAPSPQTNLQNLVLSKGAKKTNNSYSRRWTTDEDTALTKSYLYVTMDAIVGKDQTSQTMWDRIFKSWKDHMGTYDETRNWKGLQCRWGTIQGAVNKFHGIYESLERAPQSGTTPSDMIESAMNMYKEIGDGTKFKFIHCWEIMRSSPKWCSQKLAATKHLKKRKMIDDDLVNSPPLGPNTQNSVTSNANVDIDQVTEENENIDVDGNIRPPGRKCSKEKKKRLVEQKDMVNTLNSLQCTLEKQFAFNQKNLESRETFLKKEMEFKEIDQQLKKEAQKLKEQVEKRKEMVEKRNEMAEKRREMVEKRKEQERILNTDLNNLQPMLRSAFEKIQAQIAKEWEEEGFFGDA